MCVDLPRARTWLQCSKGHVSLEGHKVWTCMSAAWCLGNIYPPGLVAVCREDVREARDFLDSVGLQSCRVLAKIETRQSLLNFRGILATADGIIVSR